MVTNMAKMTTGQRIRERRKALKMSQTQLAEILGYSDKTAISKIELDINELNLSKLKEFAKVLNTTSMYLAGFIDDHRPLDELRMTDREWNELNEILGKLTREEKMDLRDRLAHMIGDDDNG